MLRPVPPNYILYDISADGRCFCQSLLVGAQRRDPHNPTESWRLSELMAEWIWDNQDDTTFPHTNGAALTTFHVEGINQDGGYSVQHQPPDRSSMSGLVLEGARQLTKLVRSRPHPPDFQANYYLLAHDDGSIYAGANLLRRNIYVYYGGQKAEPSLIALSHEAEEGNSGCIFLAFSPGNGARGGHNNVYVDPKNLEYLAQDKLWWDSALTKFKVSDSQWNALNSAGYTVPAENTEVKRRFQELVCQTANIILSDAAAESAAVTGPSEVVDSGCVLSSEPVATEQQCQENSEDGALQPLGDQSNEARTGSNVFGTDDQQPVATDTVLLSFEKPDLSFQHVNLEIAVGQPVNAESNATAEKTPAEKTERNASKKARRLADAAAAAAANKALASSKAAADCKSAAEKTPEWKDKVAEKRALKKRNQREDKAAAALCTADAEKAAVDRKAAEKSEAILNKGLKKTAAEERKAAAEERKADAEERKFAAEERWAAAKTKAATENAEAALRKALKKAAAETAAETAAEKRKSKAAAEKALVEKAEFEKKLLSTVVHYTECRLRGLSTGCCVRIKDTDRETDNFFKVKRVIAQTGKLSIENNCETLEVDHNTVVQVCSHCHKFHSLLTSCQDCGAAGYCSSTCSLNGKKSHGNECRVIAKVSKYCSSKLLQFVEIGEIDLVASMLAQGAKATDENCFSGIVSQTWQCCASSETATCWRREV